MWFYLPRVACSFKIILSVVQYSVKRMTTSCFHQIETNYTAFKKITSFFFFIVPFIKTTLATHFMNYSF